MRALIISASRRGAGECMLLDNLFSRLGCVGTASFLVVLLLLVALPAAEAILRRARAERAARVSVARAAGAVDAAEIDH